MLLIYHCRSCTGEPNTRTLLTPSSMPKKLPRSRVRGAVCLTFPLLLLPSIPITFNVHTASAASTRMQPRDTSLGARIRNRIHHRSQRVAGNERPSAAHFGRKKWVGTVKIVSKVMVRDPLRWLVFSL